MLKTETRKVKCKAGTIEYTLTRKKVKNINLRIKPDGKIYVSANRHVPAKYIDEFVASHQTFIANTLEKFRQRMLTAEKPKIYENGEMFQILGKKLELKIEKNDKEGVTSDEQYIILRVADPGNFRRKEKLMAGWLKDLQERVFEEKCREAYSFFQKYNLKYPEIKIRKMKSRWGSCNPRKAIITLNSRLIEVPEKCLEYVIIHEFSHFIHPDHSKKFYEFVAKLMPDWKEWRDLLKKL